MSSNSDPLRLPASPESARVARQAAEIVARSAGADVERSFDVAVVTSELVSNAARVASETIVVRFEVSGTAIRIEVDDDGAGRPRLIDGSESGGFGLHLVDRLSSRWGCVVDFGTKTVWAELDDLR